jgi:hypothetical protein
MNQMMVITMLFPFGDVMLLVSSYPIQDLISTPLAGIAAQVAPGSDNRPGIAPRTKRTWT